MTEDENLINVIKPNSQNNIFVEKIQREKNENPIPSGPIFHTMFNTKITPLTTLLSYKSYHTTSSRINKPLT